MDKNKKSEVVSKAKDIMKKGKDVTMKVAAVPGKPIYKAIDKGSEKLAQKVVKKPKGANIPADVYDKYLRDVAKMKGLFKAGTIVAAGTAIGWAPPLLPFSPVVKAALLALPSGSTFNATMIANLDQDKNDEFTKQMISEISSKLKPKNIMSTASKVLLDLKAKKISPEDAASEMRKLDVQTRKLAKKIDALKERLESDVVKNTKGVKESSGAFLEAAMNYIACKKEWYPEEACYDAITESFDYLDTSSDFQMKIMDVITESFTKDFSNKYHELCEKIISCAS